MNVNIPNQDVSVYNLNTEPITVELDNISIYKDKAGFLCGMAETTKETFKDINFGAFCLVDVDGNRKEFLITGLSNYENFIDCYGRYFVNISEKHGNVGCIPIIDGRWKWKN